MLRELLSYFGFEVDTKQVEDGALKLEDFEKKINRVAAGLGGALIARAAVRFTDSLIDTGNALAKQSEKFGMSVDDFAMWDYAAQHAGVSTESFANGLKFLEKNMAKNDGIGGKALKDFAQLGIDLGGTGEKMKPTLEVFAELADKVRDAKNPAEQLGIAMRFLGRGGVELVPFLKKGGDGIKALLGRFQEITGGEGGFEQFAKDAEKAKDAQIDFGLGVDVLRNKLAIALLPVVSRILDKLLAATVWIRKATKDTMSFEAAVAMLAGAGIGSLIYAIGGLVLAAAPWIAAFMAVYLIVEDLFVLFAGGHSLIGLLVDAIFGLGASQEMVKKVKEGFREFVDFLKEQAPKIKAVWNEDVLPAIIAVVKFLRDNKMYAGAFFDAMLGPLREMKQAIEVVEAGLKRLHNMFPGSGVQAGGATPNQQDDAVNKLLGKSDFGQAILGIANGQSGAFEGSLRGGAQLRQGWAGSGFDLPGTSASQTPPKAAPNFTITQHNEIKIDGAKSPFETGASVKKQVDDKSSQMMEDAIRHLGL